jgi:hypothetical protein
MQTKKKAIISLASLFLLLLGLAMFYSGKLPWLFDRFIITIPADTAVDAVEMVVAPFILLCIGVFLIFILSGVGLIVLGSFVLVGVILLLVAFPFLLPLLIPVLIVWVSIGVARRRKSAINTS